MLSPTNYSLKLIVPGTVSMNVCVYLRVCVCLVKTFSSRLLAVDKFKELPLLGN